ncbi:MAG: hypothetical protein M3M88_02275 [Thermoproteota archaeon]|nr:hypothetical protein [Thermoproteota archaeon]
MEGKSLQLLIVVGVLVCIFIGCCCNFTIVTATTDEKPPTDMAIIDLSSDGDAKIHHPVTLNPRNQSTAIDLFGRSSNAVVKDHEGSLIKSYLKENLREVDIDSSGILSATLYYNTSDLTKKYGREWIFSLFSPMRVSLILPVDSQISSWGPQNPLIITQDQKRNIIAFDPGNITVKYAIIEQPPTKDEAIISIDSAQVVIQETKDKNPLIILTDAERTLQQAIAAKEKKQYQKAIELGTFAKALLSNVTKEYDIAQSEIMKADLLVTENITDGSAEVYKALLTNAKDEFTNGNYTKSKEYVQELFKKYESASLEPGEKSLWINNGVNLLLILPLIIGGSVVLMMYVNKRKSLSIFKITKGNGMAQKKSQHPPTTKDQNNDRNINPNTIDKDHKLSLKDSVSSDMALAVSHNPYNKKDNAIDTVPLVDAIEKTIREIPHLKPEDKQVLRFLAEKEGTVFESEIRKKFILPKTTLWRLVKRLEREDLVEVQKAGTQNLIKLRYDHLNDEQSG